MDSESASAREPRPGMAAAVWGIIGFTALIGNAVHRLGPRALDTFRHVHLSAVQWGVASVWMLFMIYSEAYRGFHQQFAPRFAARALHLARTPRTIPVIIAPLFCMGLFFATKKRLIVSWCVTSGIVVLILGVRQLADPWRGIVDGGVVVGLILGTLSLYYWFARGLGGAALPVPHDVSGLVK